MFQPVIDFRYVAGVSAKVVDLTEPPKSPSVKAICLAGISPIEINGDIFQRYLDPISVFAQSNAFATAESIYAKYSPGDLRRWKRNSEAF